MQETKYFSVNSISNKATANTINEDIFYMYDERDEFYYINSNIIGAKV